MYITLHCSKSQLPPSKWHASERWWRMPGTKKPDDALAAEARSGQLVPSFAQQDSKGARLLSGYLSQTRTGKALMPDFQTMFLTLLARASKLISWAGSLSGHVLTPSYFAKLAFVFLVLFTSCQVIKWVKGAPVLSSRDHSRCIPGIPRAQAACSKGQPRPGASLSLSRCPKSVSPCLSPVDYV